MHHPIYSILYCKIKTFIFIFGYHTPNNYIIIILKNPFVLNNA